MYQFSDSDTTDSDDGVRFKTVSTRDKAGETTQNVARKRSRSRSPMRSRGRSRCRSRSRSRSPERYLNSNSSHLRSQDRDIERERRRSRCNGRFTKHKSPEISRRNRDTLIKRNNDLSMKSKSLPDIFPKERAASSKDLCGPQLPPTKVRRKAIVAEDKIDIVGPALSLQLPKSSQPLEGEEHASEDYNLYICGPALPSHIMKGLNKSKQSESLEEATEDTNVCGPALPPHLLKSPERSKICGPLLPPHLLKSSECASANSKDDITEEIPICGPALPPHLLRKSFSVSSVEDSNPKEERSIGPFIPEHLRKQLAEQSPIEYEEMDVTEDDNDDDGCYGPLPPELQHTSRAHLALEERALQMKLDHLNPQIQDEPSREEWMIELPTVQAANLGLGPRQFRAKAGPDMSDRSLWTDTPSDKKKKAKPDKVVDLQKEAEINAMRKRDEEQEAMVKKEGKKNNRDKSLIEQHQEKLNAKKKADTGTGVVVRRPFNRETDLKVNHFDEAQKKSMMKKAALLDDRFSHGQTKYL